MKPYLFALLLILSAFSGYSQILGRNYNPGAYYTNDGQKHVGLLARDFDPPGLFSNGDNTIFFKTDSGAKKEKIKVSTIKSFVVTNKDTARTDSFVTVRSNYARIKYKYDIIQVINDDGPIKLYHYRLQRKIGLGGFGIAGSAISVGLGANVTYYDNYYYYGPNADIAREMRKKDFKDIMTKILADDPETISKINEEEYKMGNMESMIKNYNLHRSTVQTQKL